MPSKTFLTKRPIILDGELVDALEKLRDYSLFSVLLLLVSIIATWIDITFFGIQGGIGFPASIVTFSGGAINIYILNIFLDFLCFFGFIAFVDLLIDIFG